MKAFYYYSCFQRDIAPTFYCTSYDSDILKIGWRIVAMIYYIQMHLYNFLKFDFPPSMPLLKRKKKLIIQAIRNWQFHPSMPKQTNMSKKVKIIYSKLSSPLPSCVVVHDFQTKTFTKTRKTKSSSKLKRISFRRISPQLR